MHLMTCGECGKPIPLDDELILGDVPFHRSCGDIWLDRNAPVSREAELLAEIERLREQLALHAHGWRELRYHVDNQDMDHATFRVQAGKAAEHYTKETLDD